MTDNFMDVYFKKINFMRKEIKKGFLTWREAAARPNFTRLCPIYNVFHAFSPSSGTGSAREGNSVSLVISSETLGNSQSERLLGI